MSDRGWVRRGRELAESMLLVALVPLVIAALLGLRVWYWLRGKDW